MASSYPPLFKVKIPSTKAKNQQPSKYIVFQVLVQSTILYTYSYEIPYEQEELPKLSALKPRTTEKGKYKNKGKVNEETPAQNIHVQAQSRWNKKVDEG